MNLKMERKELLCLILILVLACFFRLWELDSIPPGIYPDEAMNANDAAFNPGKLFYRDNNGREGLFINLIALSFKIFGVSIWSLKIVPAITGILTVLGIYLLTKELFEGLKFKVYSLKCEKVALLASFFLATSFWHVNFSRIAFRAILVPLISIFAFYFLLKALKRKTIPCFVISGALFGLGLYTYIAFRVIFLMLPVLFLFWYKKTPAPKQSLVRGTAKRQKIEMACFLASILIVALPLIIYFIRNPEDFLSRAMGVSIFAQENPIRSFFNSLVTHLSMFNLKGDPNWRHNIAGSPVLFWPIGILFLIGLFYSFKELIKSFRNENYSLLTTHYLLISWWFLMLLPGILTIEGIPHSLRCIGAIPPTFIFAGLGGALFCEAIKKRIPFEMKGFNYYLMIVSLGLLVLSFILAQYFRYFELWASNSNVESAFTKGYTDMAHYLNSLSDEIKKYVIVNEAGAPLYGISIPAQTPIFIETIKFGQPRAIYVKAENLDEINADQEKVVIVPLYDGKLFRELQQKFPQGVIRTKNGFKVYEIE